MGKAETRLLNDVQRLMDFSHLIQVDAMLMAACMSVEREELSTVVHNGYA